MDEGEAEGMQAEAGTGHPAVQEVSGNRSGESHGVSGVDSELVGAAGMRSEQYFYSAVIVKRNDFVFRQRWLAL